MKTIFKILIASAFIFSTINLQAQETLSNQEEVTKERKVRPFRIGAKVGFPNLVGGNLEYVTPLLNNKLAINFDYSTIKSDWFEFNEEGDTQNSELDISYIEGGLNYYFFKPGRGLYGGLSYGNLSLKGAVVYDEFRDIIDTSHGSMNIKLGAKLGGLIYFRPEIGYSFSALPEEIDTTRIYDDGNRETRTIEFDTEGTAYNLLFSGFMANIGLGFAF